MTCAHLFVPLWVMPDEDMPPSVRAGDRVCMRCLVVMPRDLFFVTAMAALATCTPPMSLCSYFARACWTPSL